MPWGGAYLSLLEAIGVIQKVCDVRPSYRLFKTPSFNEVHKIRQKKRNMEEVTGRSGSILFVRGVGGCTRRMEKEIHCTFQVAIYRRSSSSTESARERPTYDMMERSRGGSAFGFLAAMCGMHNMGMHDNLTVRAPTVRESIEIAKETVDPPRPPPRRLSLLPAGEQLPAQRLAARQLACSHHRHRHGHRHRRRHRFSK